VYPALQIANVADIGSGEALPVPKLIHQTWKNSEIPEKWQKAHDSCIKLHPDYEYRLWTDSDGLKFVKVRSLLLSVQPEM
jgi:mannosyltransferase OCH1-like enzyme